MGFGCGKLIVGDFDTRIPPVVPHMIFYLSSVKLSYISQQVPLIVLMLETDYYPKDTNSVASFSFG